MVSSRKREGSLPIDPEHERLTIHVGAVLRARLRALLFEARREHLTCDVLAMSIERTREIRAALVADADARFVRQIHRLARLLDAVHRFAREAFEAQLVRDARVHDHHAAARARRREARLL